MHKNTKLFPRERREAYRRWVDGDTITDLSRRYHVTRQTMYRLIKKARMDIFVNLPSINHRYRKIQYGLARLTRTERILGKKLARRAHRLKRYEKDEPGEMVHFDTKRLPVMYGEAITTPRERLFAGIDDFSRFLVADILPDKTAYSAAIFLEETIHAMPFHITKAYSDNGSEYKGRNDHAFVASLIRHKISQGFTKPRHPWTNGKAERVIKTIMTECFKKTGRSFENRAHRRRFLYAFVNWYNTVRPHESLGGVPPLERIHSFLDRVRRTTENVLTR